MESAATKRSDQKRGGATIGRWYRRYFGSSQSEEQRSHARGRSTSRTRLDHTKAEVPIEWNEVAWPISLAWPNSRRHSDVRAVDWFGGRALPNPRGRDDHTIRCRRGTRRCWHPAANRYQSLMDTPPVGGASSWP